MSRKIAPGMDELSSSSGGRTGGKLGKRFKCQNYLQIRPIECVNPMDCTELNT
jgi:hypothetical protein